MKGRQELRVRVTVMVSIAATVSLALAPRPADAAAPEISVEPNAIGGTGYVNAIGGTGLDAIGGTGRRTKTAIGGMGMDAIGGTGQTTRVVLSGPVQSASLATNSVRVLGRDLRLSSDRVQAIHQALTGGQTVELAVSGKLGKSGRLVAGTAAISQNQYVAGSTQVVLTGRVNAVDSAIGLAVIGKQVVNLTAIQTAAGSTSVKAGDVIMIVGTQPSLGGAVLAQSVDYAN
jgi:hypothetical protein